MIVQIDGETARRLLNGRGDPFSLKIESNLLSYEGCGFFSVYAGEGVVIGRYYGDLVVRTEGELSEESGEELALFLRAAGFNRALCSEETGRLLIRSGFKGGEPDILYRFSAEKVPDGDDVPDFSELRRNPPYSEVFSILRDGFPGIEHDDWYTDMNHRVRHGTANIYIYGGSTATVNAENERAAFVSLLATKNEAKGRGDAKKLLRALGLHYGVLGKEMLILCRRELMPFYEKTGFCESGRTITLDNNCTALT